jgi:hypothetical protein
MSYFTLSYIIAVWNVHVLQFPSFITFTNLKPNQLKMIFIYFLPMGIERKSHASLVTRWIQPLIILYKLKIIYTYERSCLMFHLWHWFFPSHACFPPFCSSDPLSCCLVQLEHHVTQCFSVLLVYHFQFVPYFVLLVALLQHLYLICHFSPCCTIFVSFLASSPNGPLNLYIP